MMNPCGNPDQSLFQGTIEAIGAERRLIAVLAFYGDDSGSSIQDKVCVVAGYLADSWTHFDLETRWNKACQDHPRIEYFKSHEFSRDYRKGQLKAFSKSERQEKFMKLATVAAASRHLVEFSSSIRWEDFNSSVTGAVRAKYNHPYYFCVAGIVTLISKAARAAGRADTRVAYVFDHQAEAGELHRQYMHVRGTIAPEFEASMGAVIFMDDKKTAPLQAADQLAGLIRLDLEKPSGTKKLDNLQFRQVLAKIRSGYKYAGQSARWNPDRLKAFCAKVDAGIVPGDIWTTSMETP